MLDDRDLSEVRSIVDNDERVCGLAVEAFRVIDQADDRDFEGLRDSLSRSLQVILEQIGPKDSKARKTIARYIVIRTDVRERSIQNRKRDVEGAQAFREHYASINNEFLADTDREFIAQVYSILRMVMNKYSVSILEIDAIDLKDNTDSPFLEITITLQKGYIQNPLRIKVNFELFRTPTIEYLDDDNTGLGTSYKFKKGYSTAISDNDYWRQQEFEKLRSDFQRGIETQPEDANLKADLPIMRREFMKVVQKFIELRSKTP